MITRIRCRACDRIAEVETPEGVINSGYVVHTRQCRTPKRKGYIGPQSNDPDYVVTLPYAHPFLAHTGMRRSRS